ncbi:hypothetical protein EVAR_31099_1 [Eumeta japonica]|uniref:Uncharacterized protein n=1 Tax=Eumeta variegata TaxID=151549 RepID=A0A4C1VEY3_EUMVA|nr:hypothetical protein EVAR_31099_1 [Eumeta japonica]
MNRLYCANFYGRAHSKHLTNTAYEVEQTGRQADRRVDGQTDGQGTPKSQHRQFKDKSNENPLAFHNPLSIMKRVVTDVTHTPFPPLYDKNIYTTKLGTVRCQHCAWGVSANKTKQKQTVTSKANMRGERKKIRERRVYSQLASHGGASRKK